MQDFLDCVDQRLLAAFQSNSLLSQTGSHLCLAAGAKRVRPLLVSYFAQMLSLDLNEVMEIALASEWIHSASLLHDDVIDNADSRRGRSTVNHQWSNSVAILSGNHLLALAFKELRVYAPEVTQEAITVVAEMTRSAIEELFMRGQENLTISQWRNMCLGKTGSLFAFCGTALCVGFKRLDAYEAFKTCGEHLGQMFQLADDLSDLQEDAQNLEASYPRILASQGEIFPQAACHQELLKQKQLALQAIDAWKNSTGYQSMESWLARLLDHALSI
ncbi:MAG: polyprenyl synthetase family protein [Myxococcaceae bacterium]|nr:polyprenyl synthetase family protein [Myxococcaceae bacterium]MBH2006895.1 polyprenyl synthetase family protein [Myxococcaceae bacterium]